MTNYPTIKQTFGIFGFLVLMTIVTSVVILIFNELVFKINESFSQLIIYTVPSVFTAIRYLKRKKISNSDVYMLKTKKIGGWIYLQIIVLGMLIMVIIDPLTELIPIPEWFNELMMRMISRDIYSFFTIVIIAPILEELIFRGIILDGFLKIYSPKKSIIWSALLFAGIHLNPWQAIGAFLIGLFMGWIYYRTESIIPGIIIHFTNNLIAFLLFVWSADNAFTFVELVENKTLFGLAAVCSALLFYFGVRFLNKQIPAPVKQQAAISPTDMHAMEASF